MESNQTMGNNNSRQNGKGKKTIVVIVILMLLLANGLLIWQFFSKKAENMLLVQKVATTETAMDSVTQEYNQVKAELAKMQQDNAGLQSKLTENDSLIKEQGQKIERLLREKRNVDVIKGELAKLKELKNQYEAKIAELEAANKTLTAENQNLNTNLSLAKVKNENLTQENVVLSNKVSVGSVLKADNIKALGVKFKSSGKEVETAKAKNVQKVKTCFTLLENVVADKGMKTIYVRVLTPEGSCLSASSETFTYKGQPTIYTTKQDINFDNQKQDLCIYWDKNANLTLNKGKYNIEVYCDGNQMGTGTFDLK